MASGLSAVASMRAPVVSVKNAAIPTAISAPHIPGRPATNHPAGTENASSAASMMRRCRRIVRNIVRVAASVSFTLPP